MDATNEVEKILRESGALITDSHIIGTSGRHMSVYINKDTVYPHTTQASRVGELFAEKYKDAGIEVVVGPALGGIILSQWTAYHLSKLLGHEVLGCYTEKTPENDQMFKRGYDQLVKGKRALIVEDFTTTGGSVRKVVDAVKLAGGKVMAVCVMANRDPERVTSEVIGAPFSALAVIKAHSYDPAECPLCKEGITINTSVGHGKQFLEQQGK